MLPWLNSATRSQTLCTRSSKMRRQQHGDVLVLEVADDLQQLDRRLRVETGGRLVEDRDLRILQQDLRDPEPLPHAARERRDPPVGDVVQPDMIERVAHLLFALIGGRGR